MNKKSLTNAERRTVENETIREIVRHKKGIDTRNLITRVVNKLHASIPNLNRHHVAGMLAWILDSTTHDLIVRTPGHSVIA